MNVIHPLHSLPEPGDPRGRASFIRRLNGEMRAEGGSMMSRRWLRLATFSSVFLRLALGVSFLSAVADRFGLWGAYGQPNVSWGDYARFLAYTAKLNWYLPASMLPLAAALATAAETLFGLFLVVGWKTRITALLSGILLIVFALAMTVSLGVHAPLSFSVFSAAGGALLLAACEAFPLSLDAWIQRASRRPADTFIAR